MKWKLVPVEPDRPTLSAMHEKMYDVQGMKWHDGVAAVYGRGQRRATLQMLAMSGFWRIWSNNSGRPVTMGKARLLQAPRHRREIFRRN